MDPIDGPASTTPSAADNAATLNEVLSEVIDLVQEVKQAHRKVPETHELHVELDQLFDDLAIWAQLVVEQDQALGVSPLSSMPSVAGRKPPNLWPGEATDDAVRTLVDDHLGRLEQHLRAARMSVEGNARSQEIIDNIDRGVLQHRQALSEL
jgi:DNA-binding ferritin-like protein